MAHLNIFSFKSSKAWLVVIIISTSFIIKAWSQSNSIQFPIEEKRLDAMEGVTDANYIAVWGNVDLNITKFFLINRKTNHVATHRVSSERYWFIGSISTPEDIKFYIQTKLPNNPPRIELLTFVKKGEYFQQKVLDREKYESAFVQDGKFYRLALDKKEDIIKIIVSDGNEPDKTLIFPLKDKKIQRILAKQDFEFVRAGKAISYSEAQGLNKIYVRGDKVLLVSNAWEADDGEAVLVMALDTHTNEIDIRTMPLLKGKRTKHNSFLLNDHLFVFCLHRSDIALSIHDINTGKQLKLLEYPDGVPVEFKSSDFMTDNKDRETDWLKLALDARWDRIRRTLDNKGDPFIMVEPAASNLRLIVGTYTEPRQQGGMSTMMGGGTSMAYGTSSMGPMVYMPTYRQAESHYFYGYLNGSDLSAAPIATSDTHGPIDALNKQFVKVSETRKAGRSGVIYDGSTVMLVYIDRKAKEMFIESIAAP